MRTAINESGVAVAQAERGQAREVRVGVPVGKRVLNTHISTEEHTFLKSMASKNSMTVTMFLRNLIRREMQRSTRDITEPRNY